MNRLTSSPILRMLAYGGAVTAFALSLWFLSASRAAPQPIYSAIAQTTPSYYAALIDQHVVIYLDGEPDPILITDIDVRTLPDADRRMLEKGMPLASAEAISRLLEDYGS